jgi:cyanate permease
VIPAIVAGQAVVGGVAGTVLPRDRWNYLAVAAGWLVAVFYGEIVLFPQGEQWSGDLFALAAVSIVAVVTWLPLAIGAKVGSLPSDRRTSQVSESA